MSHCIRHISIKYAIENNLFESTTTISLVFTYQQLKKAVTYGQCGKDCVVGGQRPLFVERLTGEAVVQREPKLRHNLLKTTSELL
jgi:hypothetical protein